MQKSIDALSRDLAGIRTGRASAALVDHLMVSYYDTPTPLNQIATIATPEPRLITIQAWDKQAVGNIEKAILTSGLGLNPSSTGFSSSRTASTSWRTPAGKSSIQKSMTTRPSSRCPRASGQKRAEKILRIWGWAYGSRCRMSPTNRVRKGGKGRNPNATSPRCRSTISEASMRSSG